MLLLCTVMGYVQVNSLWRLVLGVKERLVAYGLHQGKEKDVPLVERAEDDCWRVRSETDLLSTSLFGHLKTVIYCTSLDCNEIIVRWHWWYDFSTLFEVKVP